MITGQTFLVLGDEFGVYPTTTEHLLRPLMELNQFLWVHLMGLRRPQFTAYDLSRAWHKLSAALRAQRNPTAAGEPSCYAPLLVPFSSYSAIRRWNRGVVTRGVRERLRALGKRRPVLVTSLPNAAEVLDSFDEQAVVYICEDEYSEMPGAHKDTVLDMERRLLQRADAVFVTSRQLVARKSRPGRPAIFLPQGVDFDHFAAYRNRPAPIPEDLASIPKPRIGFIGVLADWVDLDLFAEVALAHPTVSVVVIGPSRTDLTPLRSIPNIHLLGPRPYAQAPRYMAHFDVGLIPFRENELTRYVNPLKLLEYFAAGLPVVSTSLPDVARYGDAVYCPSDRLNFANLVGKALSLDTAAARDRRIRLASENSWSNRAETLSEHLGNLPGISESLREVQAG